MKAKLFVITCIVAAITLFGCEGPKYFSVTVFDNQTKKPIDSVLVHVKVKHGKNFQDGYSIQGYTDSTGKFVSSMMLGTGLKPAKFDFFMEYQKPGYINKTEINKTEGRVELEHL